MKRALVVLLLGAVILAGCKKSSNAASAANPGDRVDQKLQELAGTGATNCGRLKSQAPDQVKTSSDCAMQASAGKHAFYVAYDLPGVTVGVAGNAEGKLYSIQWEQPQGSQPATSNEVTSAPCPSALRVAQSGRVTCFAPSAFATPSGSNPHGGMPGPGSMENPHGKVPMPPPGTPNPHANPTAKIPPKQ